MKILIDRKAEENMPLRQSVAKSPRADKIYCAPETRGAEYAECVDIGAMEFENWQNCQRKRSIFASSEMDDPSMGLVDVLEDAGIRTFGSKKTPLFWKDQSVFKRSYEKYDIPTAGYMRILQIKGSNRLSENAKFPIVLKADGFALGKGVLICQNFEEAKEGVKTIMLDKNSAQPKRDGH